jgi:hypothetical protein
VRARVPGRAPGLVDLDLGAATVYTHVCRFYLNAVSCSTFRSRD